MDKHHEMPMGLSFRMSMNEKAMETYGKMTEEEQGKVIEEARHVSSKEEMKNLVERLEQGERFY